MSSRLTTSPIRSVVVVVVACYHDNATWMNVTFTGILCFFLCVFSIHLLSRAGDVCVVRYLSVE